jgi:hypothetical protein
MVSIDDINAEKQAQLDIIDTRLMAAAAMRNQGVAGMAAKVAALRAQREALDEQAYDAAMNGPAMTHALARLQAATEEMMTTAAVMTTATGFLTHVNDLISAATKAEGALKGA